MLDHFKKLGFNIVLTTPVSEIPFDLYPFTEHQKKKTLIIIGSGGPELWNKIPDKTIPNFFDTYSLDALKFFSSPEILFPNNALTLPLQKFSRLLNFSHQSPIGLDINEEFGLWFAFRALALTEGDHLPIDHHTTISPCESCIEKPCLKEKNLTAARLMCPYKNEEQYSITQRDYHLKILSGLKTS